MFCTDLEYVSIRLLRGRMQQVQHGLVKAIDQKTRDHAKINYEIQVLEIHVDGLKEMFGRQR